MYTGQCRDNAEQVFVPSHCAAVRNSMFIFIVSLITEDKNK
jgi:hypothetical protein